jgi:hypothetical protein
VVAGVDLVDHISDIAENQEAVSKPGRYPEELMLLVIEHHPCPPAIAR